MGAFAEAFWGLLSPWLFLGCSVYYLPETIISLLQARDFGTLSSWDGFQSVWFAKFWAWAGPNIRQMAGQRVLPLLEGRVRNGQVSEKPVMPAVSGVVIEIGPGSGMWVDIFSKVDTSGDAASATGKSGRSDEARKRGRANDVTKVYGVEPNAGSHAELRRRADAAGLQDVYEIVPVGIESIADSTKWNGKIEDGSVDCVVSILCLCGIPEPEKNIKALYKSLKKGGRWYVYEHVRVRNNLLLGLYQRRCRFVCSREMLAHEHLHRLHQFDMADGNRRVRVMP